MILESIHSGAKNVLPEERLLRVLGLERLPASRTFLSFLSKCRIIGQQCISWCNVFTSSVFKLYISGIFDFQDRL